MAAVWIFHITEFANRRPKKTIPAAVVFLVIAVAVFFMGRAFDGRAKAAEQARSVPPVKPPGLSTPLPRAEELNPPAVTKKKQSANSISRAPASNVDAPKKGIDVGKDAVAMGRIPDGSKIGDGSVVIGATDDKGNTILNQGGLAVGKGATAGPNSIAIGAKASAGNTYTTPNIVVFDPLKVEQFKRDVGIAPAALDIEASVYEPRAFALGNRICAVLNDSTGWKCNATQAATTEFNGVNIHVKTATYPPAIVLQKALRLLDIKAPGFLKDELGETKLELWIGRLTDYQNMFLPSGSPHE